MFRIIIRIVFLFAYAAFLYASLRHIAYFFASFEPANTDWTGAYALAISIDATALILTIGIMFFRKGMSLWALAGIWFFILGLTVFSWLINWEYAIQFQSNGLNKASDFLWINPILASAFALLNVAYSIVAELFNSKSESVEELKQKNDEREAKLTEKSRRIALRNQQLFSSISGMKQVAKAAFSEPQNEPDLQQELKQNSEENLPDVPPALSDEKLTVDFSLLVPESSVQAMRPQRYFVSFEEASQITGYAISTLKQQLRAREIESNAKGDKLKISSLKVKGNTEQLPTMKVENVVATNGTH